MTGKPASWDLPEPLAFFHPFPARGVGWGWDKRGEQVGERLGSPEWPQADPFSPAWSLEECVWSIWTRCSCQVLVQQRYRHQGPAPGGPPRTRLDGHFRPCLVSSCSVRPQEQEARELNADRDLPGSPLGRPAPLRAMLNVPRTSDRLPAPALSPPSAAQLPLTLPSAAPSSQRLLPGPPPPSHHSSPTWQPQAQLWLYVRL